VGAADELHCLHGIPGVHLTEQVALRREGKESHAKRRHNEDRVGKNPDGPKLVRERGKLAAQNRRGNDSPGKEQSLMQHGQDEGNYHQSDFIKEQFDLADQCDQNDPAGQGEYSERADVVER